MSNATPSPTNQSGPRLMPCGHAESCVNPPDGDPGQTRYCRWCAEVAETRKKALMEAAQLFVPGNLIAVSGFEQNDLLNGIQAKILALIDKEPS